MLAKFIRDIMICSQDLPAMLLLNEPTTEK